MDALLQTGSVGRSGKVFFFFIAPKVQCNQKLRMKHSHNTKIRTNNKFRVKSPVIILPLVSRHLSEYFIKINDFECTYNINHRFRSSLYLYGNRGEIVICHLATGTARPMHRSVK